MKNGFLKFILAAGLVIIGLILLLSNLNIISLEMEFNWANVYPVLILGIGVKLWADALLKQGESWILGSFLTVFGGLLLLDRFQVVNFSFGDVWNLWPLLFIYVGFSLFSRGTSGKKIFEVEYKFSKDKSKTRPRVSKNAIGSQEFTHDNWKVEPMDVWNGIGEHNFDFTRAFIPEGDTPIRVRGWVGDVKMLIPRSVPFRVEAKMKTGDITIAGQNTGGLKREMSYQTEDYEGASRRLTIYVEYKVGSITISQI
ncbi:hypothetical protein EQV77_11260 [Halobacillus fulvus]|nr:hypothetical protein EQV77_11260 [Halobacillus fulvus]